MALDLDGIRQRLGEHDGPRYWRSLEELADTPEFRERLEREFGEGACDWTDPVTRRRFLTLMGASLALAGVGGCSARPAPHEKIMPYVRQPEELIPGRPLFYTTAMPLAGTAIGLLVESHEGRPTKVEGNPSHPASRGATDVFAQAAVLGLYDPDRSKTVTYRGRPRGWNEAFAALRTALDARRKDGGAGIRLLTETVTSPTLFDLIGQVLKEFPRARWYQWEPAGRDNVHAGARQAFGKDTSVSTHHDFRKADVVVSLDADFLFWGPGHLAYAGEFVERRRVRVGPGTDEQQKERAAKATMNRLYVVECTPSITGAYADHRLPLRMRDIEAFARALAAKLGVAGVRGRVEALAAKWADVVAKDLQSRPRGTTLILAGDGQPPMVHALAHAMNQALGNLGATVLFTRPVEARRTDQFAELRQLADEMKQGEVRLLALLGGNPVYAAPAELDFGGLLDRLALDHGEAHGDFLSFHLGLYQDETAVRCDWHIPEAHFLEMWGDARAHDGTAALIQPLIEPLYGGRSVYEALAAFTQYPERTGYDIVRAYWRDYCRSSDEDFEKFWREGLRNGALPDLARDYVPQKPPALASDWAQGPEGGGEGLEIVFKPDPSVFDGRFANNGWLQELPRPITRLTWDNAALVGVNTAQKHGLGQFYSAALFEKTGGERGKIWVDVVELTYAGQKLTMPAFIVPGHAEGSVTVYLGNGRERAGRVGNKVGANAYALRTAAAPWFNGGLSLENTHRNVPLACVQGHHLINPHSKEQRRLTREQRQVQERQPVHAATLAEFQRDPRFAHFLEVGKEDEPEVRALIPGPGEGHYEGVGEESKEEARGHEDRRLIPLTLYPELKYDEYKWGMAIDLTACIGCNACVIACQAENNIPVVGKEEVMRGREMHWLRVDTYFSIDPKRYPGSDLGNPTTFFQPVPCMHCEKAPCELVCPVGATAHSHDGLNDMIYNRCVGTRYCSNNCPYKVRRFNFLEYADFATESLKLGRNPDVTVRSRGVMEKCTYCVQRIRAADIGAQERLVRGEGTGRVRDGEVMTACQTACPTRAIVFGDINGPGSKDEEHSEVYRWKDEPLNYGLLAGLNTQPRTTYLAGLRNPNPELI
jgi:molybdopterin-containing oxidoreductase family iron-sulfur binding subunit